LERKPWVNGWIIYVEFKGNVILFIGNHGFLTLKPCFQQIFLAPRRTGPGLDASLKRGLSWAERILLSGGTFGDPTLVSLTFWVPTWHGLIISFLVNYGTFQSCFHHLHCGVWVTRPFLMIKFLESIHWISEPLAPASPLNGVALQIPDPGWNRIPAGQPQWYRKSSKCILNIDISQVGASQERV
jgi:hypothetical protein